MSVHTIRNNALSVSVQTLGAELTSLRTLEHELLWQSDKNIWPRFAPVLFPIVGKLKNDNYSFNDESYKLSQHGFARDKEFELIDKGDTFLEFELTATDDTLKVFPFHFSLIIRYELNDNSLTVSYKVFNPDSKHLLFSIGAHPGFNCKRVENESLSDYYLEFDHSSGLKSEVLRDGLQSNSTYSIQTSANRLHLNTNLFEKDAIVLKNAQVNRVKLLSSKSKPVIEMTCLNWPYFGIWTKKGSDDFVCLEPWFGIADNYSSSRSLEDKEGIIRLHPHETFTSSYAIKVTEN